MTERLALFAHSAEDLQAISAVLQDALVRVGDMKLYTDLNRFGLLVNRFRWEAEEAAAVAPVDAGRDQRFEGAVGYERVHCGIAFANVRSVRMRGIDQGKRSRLLNLLAVQATETGLRLDFSQDAAILLACDGIACQLRDVVRGRVGVQRRRRAPDPRALVRTHAERDAAECRDRRRRGDRARGQREARRGAAAGGQRAPDQARQE